MSTQSIIELDIESLINRTDKFLINVGKSYQSYKKYMLGSLPDAKQVFIISKLRDTLCEDDCIMEDYLCKAKQTLNKMLIDVNVGKRKKC